MLTDEEKNNVRSQVSQLQASRFTRSGDTLMPVLQGEPPDDSLAWGDLAEGEQFEMMSSMVNFEGFSPEQESQVLSNVVDGAAWMDGIDGLAEEMRRDAELRAETDRSVDYADRDDMLGQALKYPAGWEFAEPGEPYVLPEEKIPELPGPGRYEVWQTTDSMSGIAAVTFGEPMPDFPGGYTQVGVVEAESLDHAFELTNSTDMAWIEKPGVVQARLYDMDAGTRSTSIGDVIVAPDGQPYRVDKFGFAEIENHRNEIGAQAPRDGRQSSDVDSYERTLDEAARRLPARDEKDRGMDR